MVRVISKNQVAFLLQGLACALAAGACSGNQATEAESTPVYVENLPSDLQPVEIDRESVDNPRELPGDHLATLKPQEETGSSKDTSEGEPTDPADGDAEGPGEKETSEASPKGALPERPVTEGDANKSGDANDNKSDANKSGDANANKTDALREPNDASKPKDAAPIRPNKQPPPPAKAPAPSR